MVTENTIVEKRKRRILHPGLVEHARQLGVNSNYLYMVLTGRQISKPLVARYEALTGKPHVFPAAAISPAATFAPHNETPKGPTE